MGEVNTKSKAMPTFTKSKFVHTLFGTKEVFGESSYSGSSGYGSLKTQFILHREKKYIMAPVLSNTLSYV